MLREIKEAMPKTPQNKTAKARKTPGKVKDLKPTKDAKGGVRKAGGEQQDRLGPT